MFGLVVVVPRRILGNARGRLRRVVAAAKYPAEAVYPESRRTDQYRVRQRQSRLYYPCRHVGGVLHSYGRVQMYLRQRERYAAAIYFRLCWIFVPWFYRKFFLRHRQPPLYYRRRLLWCGVPRDCYVYAYALYRYETVVSVAVALVAVFYARAPCVHAAGTYVHAAVETPVFVLHGFTAHLPFRRTVEYRRHHYVCRTDLDSRAFLQRYAAALYLRLSVAPYLQVFHFYVARQQLADDRVLETQRPARAEVELAVRPAYRQFLHRQCEEVETVEEPQREAFGFRGGYVELPVPKYVDGYVYHAAVAFPDKVIGQGQMSPDVALGYRVLKERHAEAVQRKLPVPERAVQQLAVVSFFLCFQSNRPRYAARAYQHVSAHYLGG